MNITSMIKPMNNFIQKHTWVIRKHAPEILTTIGGIGVIAGTAVACKQTLRLEDLVYEKRETIKSIKAAMEEVDTDDDIVADVDKGRRALAKAYIAMSVDVVKLYAPSIIITGLSLCSIFASTGILKSRNAGLAAAYALIDKSFREYRQRTVDRFGTDVDNELRYGIVRETVTEKVKNPETGRMKTEKSTVSKVDAHPEFAYARMYDEANILDWNSDPEYNYMKLKAAEQYVNSILKSRGHIFLNEVYDEIGFDESTHTKAGQVVGWIWNADASDPAQIGDNFVSFGLGKDYEDAIIAFRSGYTPGIILDFNCTPILDYI